MIRQLSSEEKALVALLSQSTVHPSTASEIRDRGVHIPRFAFDDALQAGFLREESPEGGSARKRFTLTLSGEEYLDENWASYHATRRPRP